MSTDEQVQPPSDRIPGEPSTRDPFERDTPAALGLPEPVQEILATLSSLKLTVVLFALGIFIVLAGTFAQTKMGNWQAVDKYFRTFVAYVEFDVFVPKAFFPDRKDEAYGIPLFGERQLNGFYFPGGWLIGACMLVNLLAAHALRFKVQAKGNRLTIGLVLLGVGMLATWGVVALGDNKGGMQAQMSEALLDGLWWTFIAGLGAGLAGAVYGAIKLDRRTNGVEWWSCVTAGAILVGVNVFVLTNGDDARLKPESMRILWQLLKAGTAGGLLLAGCILTFKKRAGIVLLHAGVGLLMLSELFVGLYAVEGQMTIEEGHTTNFAQDIRTVELAFVDESGAEDVHVVIPESILKQQETIEAEGLPFVVKPVRDADGVLQFMDNSTLRRLTVKQQAALADEKVTFAEAAEGYAVDRIEPTNGLESTVDTSSVWVDLETPDGKSLGRWLFSQHLREQEVTVDGKTYKAELRFKRTYYPYSVHLVDIRKKDYVGTATPKDYSSFVRLFDTETGLERDDIRIYMNNPLRYRGQTLYQTDYKQQQRMITRPDGRPVFGDDGKPTFETIEYTTLSVVTNRGWMLPYVCCMIVAIGLLYQFSVVLQRFLGRKRRERIAAGAPSRWQEFVPLAVTLLIAGLVTAYMARPASTKPEELSIHAFGTLPVTSKGRVKPLDSLARNQLLIVSERERYRLITEDEDAGKLYNDVRITKKSRPAIEWLLDTATNPKKADTYPIFRITEPNLISDLGLENRPGFLRYSYAEIEPRIEVIRNRVRQAGTDEEKWNFDQRKAIELYNHMQTYFALQLAFRDVHSAGKVGQTPTQYLRFILLAADDLERIPYATPFEERKPGEDPQPKWGPYALAAARMWLKDFAIEQQAFDADDVRRAEQSMKTTEEGSAERRRAAAALERARLTALGEKFVAAMKRDGSYEQHLESTIDALVQVRLRDLLASMMRESDPSITAAEATTRARQALLDPPARVQRQLDSMEKVVREEVAESLSLVRLLADREIVRQLVEDVPKVLGEIDWLAPHPPEVVGLHDVLAAYRNGDVAGFDAAITAYRDVLDGTERFEYEPGKVRFEAWFNGLAPFFIGQYLSLFAFVLALASWLVAPRSLARAAFGLMVFVLLLATFALCCRIYISGRPPVTNLYSSAVFIAWGGILLGLIQEGVYRTGVGTAVAAMAGFLSLGIAQFLALDGDTIAVMQAVLDTNIWLATHVVCVTMGYAATFVAGFFGLWFVFMGLCSTALDKPREDKLANMIYGTLCFGLLFSFVGTVLGGLWADDSWGRFWGWDPKENGALIIVLWNALVLHARWDGLVKNRGLAVLAIAGNITTSWSWFGTNELRAGLHSYGFTEGVLAALAWTALAHLVVIAIAAAIPKDVWPSFAKRNRP